MKPLLPLRIALCLVGLPTLLAAQDATREHALGPVGHALHWCTFNTPCNWTSHAAIAAGVVAGLRRAEVSPKLAAASAALLFVAKEVRDHARWGDFGSTDSLGDLAAGVLGAYVGYRLFGRDHESRLAPILVEDGEATRVGLRLRL